MSQVNLVLAHFISSILTYCNLLSRNYLKKLISSINFLGQIFGKKYNYNGGGKELWWCWWQRGIFVMS